MSYFYYIAIPLLAIFFLIFAFLAFVIYSTPRRLKFSVQNKHAFITGGSKGIGRELAAELLRNGAKTVSIAARSVDSLIEAKKDLETYCKNGQKVEYYSMDVTEKYEEIEKIVREAEKIGGPVDLLINNAGFVVQGAFDEIPTDSFLKQMQINYIGGAHLSRAVISGMKSRRSGHICFVSSAAGQCAIWGYSAYSPSKFAVRGFADALHMELYPYGVGVSVVYPPNTDTEGFAVEKEEMPEEIRLISDASGLFTPKEVAQKTVKTIEQGGFSVTMGLEGWMLGTLTAGASPEPTGLNVICQSLLGGLLRAVMLIYLGQFNGIVQKIHEKKKEK